MYDFTSAISCFVETSNIPSKFVKYIDAPCFKAVTARKIINLYHVASSRLHITQQGHITVQGCILSNSDTMHKSKKGTLWMW